MNKVCMIVYDYARQIGMKNISVIHKKDNGGVPYGINVIKKSTGC